MPPPEHHARIRFDSFELDLQTRELRKHGRLIKLQDQPGRLLVLLASRAGELVTREEIEKALWREDEFVEFEHAVNTAMRKIRVALGDDLERPHFIETLPRKGYRFIAPVGIPGVTGRQNREELVAGLSGEGARTETPVSVLSTGQTPRDEAARANGQPTGDRSDIAPSAAASLKTTPPARAETDFSLPRPIARVLFLIVQAGYLAMYCAALYRAEVVKEALGRVLGASWAILAPLILVAAMCGIAVRLYLLSSVGLSHLAAGAKFRRLFPALFILDTLWAISPLLLVPKIGFGLALAAIAPLAYLPFSQRTLMKSIYGSRNFERSTDL